MKGTVTIEFERPLVQPVAEHIEALINEVLEPFHAAITDSELPLARVEPRQYKRPEILDAA
jgi:hypothetical protein